MNFILNIPNDLNLEVFHILIITIKRLSIIICASPGFACKTFIKDVLLSLKICESSVVRTVKGWGI